MEVVSSIIETGVDKLVKLVKQSGRISVPDAAKILSVSSTIVMEWADFLEEESIINVEYKLTKPFLVDRKITKKEVEEKSKEFETKKDLFVRRSEMTLGLLERQAIELKNVKNEFNQLKKKFGIDLGDVRSEMKELESYESEREHLTNRIMAEKANAEKTLGDLISRVSSEEKNLKLALASIRKEESLIHHEEIETKVIEKTEKFLIKKLALMKELVSGLDEKLKKEDSAIKSSEQRIIILKQGLQKMKNDISQNKGILEPLLAKSKDYEDKIKKLHDVIIAKIEKKKKGAPDAKKAAAEIKKLFNKKLAVIELVDNVNKQRNLLEKEFTELIKKAKSFQLSSKSASTGKKMLELEKKFEDVGKKNKIFENEYKKLRTALRS